MIWKDNHFDYTPDLMTSWTVGNVFSGSNRDTWQTSVPYFLKGSETIWKTKNSSYSVQIGKTTFIVCVKQSETAKKPIEKVFKDICRHEVQEDFFSAGLLSLEKLKKSS